MARLAESRIRQIIREEAERAVQESFLSKAADFFGSSNRTGKDVKMRAFDLLDHASFERWPGASTWERKLRDITKMGQHTAAERLGAVQGAEEAFKSWLRRDAETRASAEDAKWRGGEARRQRDDKESWRKADAESERRREEFRKKLESEDLIPTGEDASGNLMYTTRDDYNRQRASGRTPTGSIEMRESRIRQIIREETLQALREGVTDDFDGGEEVGDPFAGGDEMEDEMEDEMDEAGDFDAFLTIFNVSELVDAMDMSPEDLVTMLEDIAHRDFRGRVVLTGEDGGGRGPDGPPYSEEYDAIGAMGSRSDLERFVRAVENEIQGPAQSMEEGEGFDYEIQDL